MIRFTITSCLMLTYLLGQPAFAIDVNDVLIQLVEEVHVPARQAAVLETLSVREGDMVRKGDVLAQLDDQAVRIERDRTVMELEIATRNSKNDVRMRLATKARELAQAELRRALESIETYSKSISESEIDRSRLTVQHAELEVEQAAHDQGIAAITQQLKQTQLRAAEYQLEQRKIVSPLNGIVAEVSVREGEWVTPGQRVLRILRVDRLRAQGFLPAAELSGHVKGHSVTLQVKLDRGPVVTLSGTIVFESEEVDPVDGQVMVWAEFDNLERKVRPGMRGKLTIHPEVSSVGFRDAAQGN